MKYEEVLTKEALEPSPHQHAFINPYNGCSMGCPFCFWLSRKGWEGRIQIRKNIPKLLEQTLKQWPKDEYLYMGSVCDPFNELEEQYRLTRRCLKLLEQYEIPLLITTSGVRDVLICEAEILKRMGDNVIVVVELARIQEIEKMNRGEIHSGIRNANLLCDMGIRTWATVSPVCPGIIEVEPFLERLDSRIPIYVDSLQCEDGSIQQKRVMEWIKKEHPQYEEAYRKILYDKDVSYYQELLKKYKTDKRVKTFPFELNQG